MMVKAKKRVKDGVRRRPVRVGSVVLSVLLALNVQVFGEDASNYVWIINIAAPLIAGFIIERFTFSQAFLLDILRWVDEYSGRENNAVSKRIRVQSRNKRVLSGDRGVSDLVAILIVFLIIIFLLVVMRRI